MAAFGGNFCDRRGEVADDLVSLTSITSSMFSSVPSHSTMIDSEGFVPRTKICLIGDVSPTLEAAAECFELEVVKSKDGQQYLGDASVVLVLSDFDPDKWGRMLKIKWRVLGSTAVVVCANDNVPLPVVERPLYCFTMKGVVTCFTGIRDVQWARELMGLIRAMGGSVRREPDRFTTHLISVTTVGKKYQYAVTFLVPIMSPEWVSQCWKMRDDPTVLATDELMMKYRLGPFAGVFAAFVGFPKDELDDMAVALSGNGGQIVEATSPLCTHIVADDLSPVAIPAGVGSDVEVVRAEWFWSCIQQVNRLLEEEYQVPPERFRRPPQRGAAYARVRDAAATARLHDKENEGPAGAASAAATPPTPPPLPVAATPLRPLRPLRLHNLRRLSLVDVSAWNSPDRDRTMTPGTPKTPGTPWTPSSPTTPGLFSDKTLVRLHDDALRGTCSPRRRASAAAGSARSPGPGTLRGASRRAPTPCGSATPPRRRPSTSGCSRTPGSPGGTAASPAPRRLSLARRGSLDAVASAPVSARFGAFLELMHTEENYVGILDTLLQMRMEALNTSQAGGALLSQTEAKMIFGALMPIARTHHALLKDLRFIHNNWRETANIGEVFQRYSPDLLRDYVPFVSTFEDSKEAIQQAGERNPRFHAFLKVCKGRPECGRQELGELLIRPVQRLASCKLLLREILKHTPADSPDRKQIECALESLSQVLSLINEDKRKMESMCKVFGVYSLVEKCPAHVIASHRSLVLECEGVEVSDHGFGKQGNHIALFVFTDVILVCKKKSKVVAMMKGRSCRSSIIPHRVLKLVDGKPYKFLQLLPLSTIRKIVDVSENDSAAKAMGLVFRGKAEVRESCSYFRLPDEADKAALIERWSCALASHNCVADPAKFVQRQTAEEAGILSAAETLARQLNKAAQVAVMTQVMMTSALGLGRTSSTASKSSTSTLSPPCVMSSFNSMSKLETKPARLETLGGDDGDEEEEELEKPKPASLTAKIMKRM